MFNFHLMVSRLRQHQKTEQCVYGCPARKCTSNHVLHSFISHLFQCSISNRKGESVTLKGHTGAVRSVNFSQDGMNLVTASDDKTAKVRLPYYFMKPTM